MSLKPRQFDGGIMIDFKCDGIVIVYDGVFVPTSGIPSWKEIEFEQEFQIFLKKWFNFTWQGSHLESHIE